MTKMKHRTMTSYKSHETRLTGQFELTDGTLVNWDAYCDGWKVGGSKADSDVEIKHLNLLTQDNDKPMLSRVEDMMLRMHIEREFFSKF